MAKKTPIMQVRDYQTVAQFGSFLRLNRYVIRHPLLDGELSGPVERVDVFRNDAAAGLLHLAHGDGRHELFLVRQFRFSTMIDAQSGAPDFGRDGRMIELMAGVCRPGEPPLETLRRETMEETGLELEDEVLIGSFYPSPGACSEQIHLYYAKVRPPSDDVEARIAWGADADEETERLRYSPAEFLDMIKNGQLADAKAYAAAEWMRRPENLKRFGMG